MFQKVEAQLPVHLAPQWSDKIEQGIKNFLDVLLTKYIFSWADDLDMSKS
jgi:hypothetical protein